MKIFHYIKNKAGSLLWMLAFLLSYQGYSQMGTFGNTYVGNGREITLHNAQQNFLNGGSGVLPGIVGTQRTALQGYLSFFGTSSWISASDNAHVDGYAKTYMTTPFTFPIGDNGRYRPAAVSTASTANPADAAYYGVSGTSAVTSSISGGNEPILPSGGPYPTSSLGTGITAVDDVEYWDINGATAANITVTYDPNSSISTLTGGNLSRLTIVGWDGTKWVEVPSTVDVISLLGGSSSLSDGSITSKSAIVPNTYSIYSLGAKAPLPAIALTNICPASTVNFTTALDLSGTLPANTEITWHTGFPATIRNKVADATIVSAGTYYGAYHDTVNDCYSPVSSAVTVIITVCANPDTSPATAGVLKNIPILTNDKNPDGTSVTDLTKITTPTIATTPTKGTVTVKADGSVDYTPNPGTSGTDTFIYSICDKTNPTVCDTAKVTVTITNKVCLLPKAYLQGALFGVLLPNALMRDDLRVKNLIPTASPYTGGLTTTGSITSSIFSVTGSEAIVDWVFVELRSGLDSTVIVDSRSALIQRDGDIVDVDGVSSVKFTQANARQYYLVVKHRNHLGVMSVKTPMDNTCAVVDFRNVSTPNYNFNASNAINLPQVDVQQGKALWAGNSLYDTDVIYQGTNNDVNVIYQQVINASGNFFVSPSYRLKGYYPGDIDLNGETIFQGTGNDIEFIYQNVIKNHLGNIFKLNYYKIKQQIP